MVKGPCSHGKTLDEVAFELRVYLARIKRRRTRFRYADEKHLRDVRKRVVEAVAAGISTEQASASTGYSLTSVTRWLAKARGEVRIVPVEQAQDRLDRIRERRERSALEESRISVRARSVVRKAMEVGLGAQEFSDRTGYTLPIVKRWFASVRRSIEQAWRQRELASVRRGKRNRPPQHLSEVEYDQWLVREALRRRTVLRRYGLRANRASQGKAVAAMYSSLRRHGLRGKRVPRGGWAAEYLPTPPSPLPRKPSVRRPRRSRKHPKK